MPRSIEEMVNEQIARWRLERSRPDRSLVERESPPVVTVAHALGSNGAAISNWVGVNLDVPVHDREILDHVASTSGVRVETVECLDERARGLLEEFLTSLFRERGFHRSDYLQHLTEAVLAMWQHGRCVMVGHGCVHIVPRENALAVRFNAPFDVRLERVASRRSLEPAEARLLVRQVDDERAAFHRVHFGAEVNDPLLYDLVLDTSMLSSESCAAIVAEAYRQKFATRLSSNSGRG